MTTPRGGGGRRNAPGSGGGGWPIGRIDRSISCSLQSNTCSHPNICTNRGSAGTPWAGIYILVVVGVCGFVGGGVGVFGGCVLGGVWGVPGGENHERFFVSTHPVATVGFPAVVLCRGSRLVCLFRPCGFVPPPVTGDLPTFPCVRPALCNEGTPTECSMGVVWAAESKGEVGSTAMTILHVVRGICCVLAYCRLR